MELLDVFKGMGAKLNAGSGGDANDDKEKSIEE